MTFWLMIKMMIHNLMNKSFNTFDSHELNDFLKICHVLITLISFFKRFRSLHFNQFRMIVIVLRLSILNFWLSLMLMIRRKRWDSLRSRLLNLKTRRFRRNVKDSWKSTDFASRFVMFDTWKNLLIALFRIKKSFWCFLSWFRNDWIFDELTNNINCLSEIFLSNDLLNDLSENDERIFKSNKSISINESRIDFRKNWFEMIDENNLNENEL
jgi:hypothetical protein